MKTNPIRFTQTLLSLTCVLAFLFSAPAGSGPIMADGQSAAASVLHDQIAAAKDDQSTSPKLESALRQLAAGPSAHAASAQPDLGTDLNGDEVRVIVMCHEGKTDDVASLVEGLGGAVEVSANGKLQCVVPVAVLNEIASSGDVELVRLPFHPVPEAITEGVELINADEWQDTGYSGAGIKIGVLDIGFYDYSSLVGTELPAPVDVSWAPSVGDEGTDAHGTACAEIIHDFAPNADLYFATCATDAEWDDAVTWLIGKDVDIISCSLGWYIVGPRDGSGDIGAAIDAAKAAGIFWAQAAGDYAQQHWAGLFHDADADRWHEYSTSPLVNFNTILANEGDEVWVRVGWDDPWGSATNDYDLDVWDSSISEDRHWYSWTSQGGSFPYPYEEVTFTAPETDEYRIYVYRYGESLPVNLEIFCSHTLEFIEESGSISDNAASPSACTVGAVAWNNPAALQPYSAQGPTADSRTKPDLVGPDTVTTETYGTEAFTGTSVATPHVAGAAALVLEAFPSYDEEDILSYLTTSAVDLGASGMDDLFGWGQVLLLEAPATDDYGDAPDPEYPTLSSSNGARHTVVEGFCLGAGVDAEGNALQNSTATGDDTIDGSDDEDGVAFTSALDPGQTASLAVTASEAGKLDGWIDFNDDGDWTDAGEKLWSASVDLSAGTNDLDFDVPSGATVTTTTFARFRFSSAGSLSYEGPADDGEVEDYRVTIGRYDWGDAPDPDYPTLLNSDGARHVLAGPFLGATIDAETNGQPDANATGDDLADNDDDDGVSFTSDLVAGDTATVDVTASGVALLDAWIDFNNDGDWDDDGEQAFASESLAAGVNTLTFDIPLDAVDTDTFARFRISAAGGLIPTGEASTGEVEDYKVTVLPPPEYDFGDAPDPSYPTLLASNGASHIIVSGWYLGTEIDKEDDGQPNANAKGDDTDDGGDDEDGVAFTAAYASGETMTLNVTASQAGYLDAWVDFNDDGDWADPGEQVFTSESLSAGINSLSFDVPGDAVVEDSTFARFRFSSAGGLSYTGEAEDGEVEDYELSSKRSIELSLKAGWNMVSVPVIPDEPATAVVFADAVAVFEWNPVDKKYERPGTIDYRKGYWVAVTADTTLTIEGIPVESWTGDVLPGWNMTGSAYGHSVASGALVDVPSGSILRGAIYRWSPANKAYVGAFTIEPGLGYWSAATQGCSLTLPPPP